MRAFLYKFRNRLLGIAVVLGRIDTIRNSIKNINHAQKNIQRSTAATRKGQDAIQRALAQCLDLLKAPAAVNRRLPKMGTMLAGVTTMAEYDCKSSRTELHSTSRRICKEAVEIFNDPPELLRLSETILRETLLPKINHAQRALDVGCGNGHYTFLLADRADEIFAFDISEYLIGQAREEASRRELQNIEFAIADLESGLPHGPFDVIGCMGVLVTIIDDEPYRMLLDQLSDRLKTGGFLITKDTTSIYPEGNIVASNGYVRNYRHVALYEGQLKKAGLGLIDKIELTGWENFVNHFYLWKKLDAADLASRRVHDHQSLLERSRERRQQNIGKV
jgi:SAM-dependent methyltransferase